MCVLSCYYDPRADFHCHAQKEEGFCVMKEKELGRKAVQKEEMEEERGGRRKGVKRSQ